MVGKKNIADLLGRVCGADFGIIIADEAVCGERAFPIWRRGMVEEARVKEEKQW